MKFLFHYLFLTVAVLQGLFLKKPVNGASCLLAGCECRDEVVSSLQTSRKDSSITCRGKNILTIPELGTDLFALKATTINFGNNSLHALEANAFNKLKYLKQLLLDENNIEDVSISAFNISKTQGSVLVSPLEVIDLKNNHLHHFPACFGRVNSSIASLSNLRTLLVGGNLFGAEVDINSFSNIRNLVELDISDCLMRVVPDLIFKMLHRLERLDLSRNNIHKMSNMVFAQDVPLQILKLHCNQLQTIPQNLPRSLKELYLSSNNIRTFGQEDRKDVSRISKLQILDLSNNKIDYLIPFFLSHFKELMYLDLSNNWLPIIESGSFHGLDNLRILFLNHNINLKKISTQALVNLSHLQHLFLHQCKLKTVNLENNDSKNISYPPLKTLWLFGNPLTCDCKMVPLVTFIKRRHVKLDAKADCIVSDITDDNLKAKVKEKFQNFDTQRGIAMCSKPLNRHYKVVGIPLLHVAEGHLTCPDEPFYVTVACFLGIIAFLGVIPIVYIMIQTYLLVSNFVQAHFGSKPEKEE